VADASSQADQYHRNPPSPVLCLRIDNVRPENSLTLDVLYQVILFFSILQLLTLEIIDYFDEFSFLLSFFPSVVLFSAS
jgi:hypothetical protein